MMPDVIMLENEAVRVHASYGREVTMSVYIRRPDAAIKWAFDQRTWQGKVQSDIYRIISDEWDSIVSRYGGEPAFIVWGEGILRIVDGKSRLLPFTQVE